MSLAILYRFRLPIAAAVAVLALLWALNRYVAGEVQDDRNKAAVEALQGDARADDIAGQVAATEQATIERQNDEARREAVGSDDPLKSGLDRLRKRKAGSD